MILLVVLVQLIFTFNYYHLIGGSTSGTTPGASIITVTAATTTSTSNNNIRVNNNNFTNVVDNNNNKNNPLLLSSFFLRREGEGHHSTDADTDTNMTDISTIITDRSSNVRATSLQLQQQYDKSTFPFFFRGVQFEREVVNVADGINMTLMFNTKEGANNCDVIDQYGHNKCKFHWSDDMTGTLQATSLPFDFYGSNYEIVGNFTVDGTIPFNFVCDVCGSNCTLGTLPFLDEIINIKLPKCPLKSTGVSIKIGEPLPSKVYTPETIITGIIQVVSKNNNKNNNNNKKKQQQQQQQHRKEKEEEQQQQQKQNDTITTTATASSTTSGNVKSTTNTNTLVEIKATIKLHW